MSANYFTLLGKRRVPLEKMVGCLPVPGIAYRHRFGYGSLKSKKPNQIGWAKCLNLWLARSDGSENWIVQISIYSSASASASTSARKLGPEYF